MVVRQRVALLHRSESQQWMLTPGSSSVWQCRAVAQPLVSMTPNATAAKQNSVFEKPHAGLHRINFCLLLQAQVITITMTRLITTKTTTPAQVFQFLHIP